MSTVPIQAPAGAADHALRVLYRDHATALLRYAQWFTDDPSAAEDAVQETFLRAWRHLPRLLDDGRPLRPWLRQVLRRVLIDPPPGAPAPPGRPPGDAAADRPADRGPRGVLPPRPAAPAPPPPS